MEDPNPGASDRKYQRSSYESSPDGDYLGLMIVGCITDTHGMNLWSSTVERLL